MLVRFLKEDIGRGDITSELLVPTGSTVKAEITARECGLVAGVDEVQVLCKYLDLDTRIITCDGSPVKAGATIIQISGKARTILSAERTLLNILSRMSGIATITNRLMRKIREAGFKTRVACTRKVAPGFGYFDKKAVLLGGGDTHRLGLDDLILIKDNHVKVVGSVKQAVRRALERTSFAKKIEVEVTSPKDALHAIEAKADIIMLDNFPPAEARKTVPLLKRKRPRGNFLIEASGGINEKNILEYAEAGVDIVSIGMLTHSVKSLDLSLDIVEVKPKS